MIWEGKEREGEGKRWGLIYAGTLTQTRRRVGLGEGGRLARVRSRSGDSRSDPVQSDLRSCLFL